MSCESGVDSVAKVVWPWRTAKEEPRLRRRKLTVQTLVGLLLGLASYQFYSQTLGLVAGSVALSAGLLGLLFPPIYRRAQSGFQFLVGALSKTLSYLLFVPLYYFFFTPFRFFFRRGGRSRMRCALDPGADTYWRKAQSHHLGRPF